MRNFEISTFFTFFTFFAVTGKPKGRGGSSSGFGTLQMVVLNGANNNFLIQKKYYGSASEAFLRSRGCPENTCPKFFVFFQKFSLSMMTQYVSRWNLVPQLSFFPYGQKCEKCHFSHFVILTKKIANNVFCKYSHYNLHKNLSTLGT